MSIVRPFSGQSVKCLPILLKQLNPTVRITCQIVDGLAYPELLKELATIVASQISRVSEFFVELPPHSTTISCGVA